ncbi:leucine-rich repeat transmembrane protein kinase protein [Artemisia annua]|uniref:Leucine-rich repeat transmembrane protein kinase protein n=1 Tax=Artemisia annua TaxID=35608 RepID=A0A2U1MER2_ARTAN|nr:leucine-rich repeat transmembrane protein kinase protein [Artemisia annua]
MKMFYGIFPTLVLVCLFVTSILVRADDDQSGFISIDCGIAEGLTYTDNVTVYTQLMTLRSFPENIRNCYTLKPAQGKGHGTPFISTIELRLLGSNMYTESDYGPLCLFRRLTCEFRYGIILRYKVDKYDRLWMSNSVLRYFKFPTNDTIYSDPYSNIDPPPSEVMTAACGPSFSDTIELRWYPVNASDRFFFYLHFAETDILKANLTRGFNIYLNGNYWDGPIYAKNRTTTTIYSREPEIAAPSYTLTINSSKLSKSPPIINALELYTLKPLPQRQTDDQDGKSSALWNIKSSYKVTKHWQGDPCAPQEFVWDGVRCSFNDTESPRIIYLDLSNNNLTGTIPKFLAGLKFLKVLNLKGNNFVSPLPLELLEKSNKGSLSLSFDGEGPDDSAGSCDTNHCKNKKDNKFIVPVVATAASLFMILIALTAIWMIKKQKARGERRTGTELEIKKQEYILRGGFGTVYHGHIDDTQVAVKILSRTSHQGDKEFQAEANLLLNIHHKNITSLVGYCNEGSHKGIIYEYMVNGDLESHIFDVSSNVLSWEERLRIGCDAAHGLEYLHHGCKPGIVHRDIKCTNILLNGTFQAKLADFGLSKAFPAEGGTHISTVVAGTPGYLDPE